MQASGENFCRVKDSNGGTPVAIDIHVKVFHSAANQRALKSTQFAIQYEQKSLCGLPFYSTKKPPKQQKQTPKTKSDIVDSDFR